MAELPDVPKTEIAIVEQTNAFRRSEKLAPVKPNSELARAAKQFAEYLARTGRFAHEADGRQPADRVKAAGYRFCMVSENLASHLDSRGFTTAKLAELAVEGWKGSPGHRKNMVEPHVTEIGVGIAKAPSDPPKFVSVQLFARPDSLKYSFRIQNRTDTSVRYSVAGETHTVDPRVIITHTLCKPTDIVFERTGNFLTGTRIDGRFTARDGVVYSIVSGGDGRVRVEVESPSPASQPRK
jgi:hypothetical protein